jgi:hypothetical protein
MESTDFCGAKKNQRLSSARAKHRWKPRLGQGERLIVFLPL